MASARPLRPRLLRSLLLVPLALAGCSGDDNDDDGLQTTTAAPASSSSSDASSGSTAPTTTEVATGTTSGTTTGDEPTGTSTTTGDEATTDATTDTTTDTTTGPICDPGQVGCICAAGQCADGLVCELDVCVAPLVCPGDLEPDNSAEDLAKNVGSITDDNGEALTVSGVLSGADDVDWYTYHGKDTFGYVAEPTVNVIAGAQRLCQFIVCDEGGPALTEVNCPDGSKFALSPMLRPGCCATTSFVIDDFNCKGQDESSTMWIRVDKPTVDECTSYELKINF